MRIWDLRNLSVDRTALEIRGLNSKKHFLDYFPQFLISFALMILLYLLILIYPPPVHICSYSYTVHLSLASVLQCCSPDRLRMVIFLVFFCPVSPSLDTVHWWLSFFTFFTFLLLFLRTIKYNQYFLYVCWWFSKFWIAYCRDI